MNRISFTEEIDKTRLSVSQITCWCMTIALHQAFGIGKTRLERVHTRMIELEEENSQLMVKQGKAAAAAARKAWFTGICDAEFRVPLLRAPRGNREKQLAMAGNNGASIAWQVYGRACVEVLGFGSERMKRLKEESWKNYQQFNAWAHEDLDWAMEKIRRCAEDALQSELVVLEDDGSGAKQAEREFAQMQWDHTQLKLSAAAASSNAAANHVVMQSEASIQRALEASLRETLESSLRMPSNIGLPVRR